MRKPGLNYFLAALAHFSKAALIPREGIVLGAIDPAKNMLEDGIIAEKETQRKSRADAERTRYLPKRSSAETTPQKQKNVKTY